MNNEQISDLRRKAEQGDAVAQYNLGVMFEEGYGVQQDYGIARQWYEKSAAQGDATAQFNLGGLYYNGNGVPQDYVLAYMWWSLASAHSTGDEQKSAVNNREVVARNLTPAQVAEAQMMASRYDSQSFIKGSGSSNRFAEVGEGIGMGLWLLAIVGASVGWLFGGGGGSWVGAGVGVILAFVGHQLQRRSFLFNIHAAARVGDVARLGELLKENPSLVNSRDASGSTPLHCAIGYFELGVVEKLLTHGADVNAPDNNGATPLHILAAGVPPNPPPFPKSVYPPGIGFQDIHLKIAKLLLARSANLHARTTWGWTPREMAEKANTGYILNLLSQHND